MHTPQGKSERTIRRQKKALRDLRAQGFQTLPDFFEKKAKEKDERDKFKAMVARVKAKLRALQGAEEEESGTETETEDKDEDEDNFKPDTLTSNSSVTAHHTFPSHSDLHPDTFQEPSRFILKEEEESDDE